MRQRTLQAVTLETLATASQAAHQAVSAYQLGGQRLLAVIDARISTPAAQGTERYAPRLAAMLRRRSSQAQRLAERGLSALGQRTGAVISATADGVASQVKRVARLAQDVDSPVLAKSLDTAARLSLPGAQVALALSNRVAAAADKLPTAAKVKAKAKAAAVRRRAAAKPVATLAQTAVTRARRSANATIAQAAKTGRAAKAELVQQAAAAVDAVQRPKAAKVAKPAKATPRKTAKLVKAPAEQSAAASAQA